MEPTNRSHPISLWCVVVLSESRVCVTVCVSCACGVTFRIRCVSYRVCVCRVCVVPCVCDMRHTRCYLCCLQDQVCRFTCLCVECSFCLTFGIRFVCWHVCSWCVVCCVLPCVCVVCFVLFSGPDLPCVAKWCVLCHVLCVCLSVCPVCCVMCVVWCVLCVVCCVMYCVCVFLRFPYVAHMATVVLKITQNSQHTHTVTHNTPPTTHTYVNTHTWFWR